MPTERETVSKTGTRSRRPKRGDSNRNGSEQRLVPPRFVERMEAELKANTHKGDWRAWRPSPPDTMIELWHHVKKLEAAVERRDAEAAQELAADVANIASKVFEAAGRNDKLSDCP